MSDDKFKQKLQCKKVLSKKELLYPENWLLTEQEKEKIRKESDDAINLFTRNDPQS